MKLGVYRRKLDSGCPPCTSVDAPRPRRLRVRLPSQSPRCPPRPGPPSSAGARAMRRSARAARRLLFAASGRPTTRPMVHRVPDPHDSPLTTALRRRPHSAASQKFFAQAAADRRSRLFYARRFGALARRLPGCCTPHGFIFLSGRVTATQHANTKPRLRQR